MANRNNFITNFWQNVQQNSVSWGSLALWIFGLVVLLVIVTNFANT